MNRLNPTMHEVLAGLASNDLVGADWEQPATEALATLDESQPWYVRAMVGFGAWLASLLLISFVVGLSVAATEGGYLVLGLLFMAGAVVVRRVFDNDFTNQMALAASLAGQVLFAIGMADFEHKGSITTFFMSLIVVNAVLIVLFADKTHRFLSIIVIVSCVIGLLYNWELQALIPAVGPLLALSLLLLVDNEATLVVKGWDDLLRPVMAGIMVSSFGCLMLSTVYVLPELARELSIYPRPWISTVLLGGLLLFVERRIWTVIFGDPLATGAVAGYALTVALIVAALPAPGLILALFVTALGAAQGSRVYMGAGIVFLAVFTGFYFYGIEVTMLVKSVSLVGTGVVVLLARWTLVSLARRQEEGAHA